MQRIKYGETYAMRVKVKRVIEGEAVDFDLSKCKGMSAELIGAVKRYPLIIATSGNVITADIDTSIFPEPDTDEGTAFALSVKGYEKGRLWRIMQNRFLVVMPADWSPSSGGGDCDCEEALAEIRTKNTEQDGDITACEKKNEEQDKRLDEIEEVDKRQDKRLNTLRVLPFDGQTPAADGASGLYYDGAQGKFVAVNSTEAFAAKGCKETDYNDAKTAKALETQLYLCGSVLHQVKGGKLVEYCAEEKEEIETLRKRSDALRILPFDGEMTDTDTDASGLMFNLTSKKFVTMGADDAFAAKGYKEADYNETDTEGNVSPIAGNLYTCDGDLYCVKGGTLTEFFGYVQSVELLAQYNRKKIEGLKMLPFDGTTATATSGLLYDAGSHKFVSKGDTDAFRAYGYTESDYNEQGEVNFVTATVPRTDRLYVCGAEIYTAAAVKALEGYVTAYTLTARMTVEEKRNTEQDERIKACEALIRLYSEEGGKVLVDGYNVTLRAGELECVHAFGAFKTNGAACSLIDVSRLNTEDWTSFRAMFENYAGKTLDLSAMKWKTSVDTYNMFKGCDALQDLQLGVNWSADCNGDNYDFSGVTAWTRESMETSLVKNTAKIKTGAEPRQGRIVLALDAYDRLTADDLTTLTDKGYTVEADGSDENRIESMTWGTEIKDE